MIKMTLSQPEIKMKIDPARVVHEGGGGGTNDHTKLLNRDADGNKRRADAVQVRRFVRAFQASFKVCLFLLREVAPQFFVKLLSIGSVSLRPVGD